MKVADILAIKGSNVVTIKPLETIGALSLRLREKRIGAAIVSDNGLTVDGVISERDVAYGLCVHKADLHAMPVLALMTKAVPRKDVDPGRGQRVAVLAAVKDELAVALTSHP